MTEAIDPEQELMLRFQRGDEVAFDLLYRRIRGVVFRIALRMLREQQTSEEAAQDILMRVYKARRSYRPQVRFRTWLHRVAINHCINERKRLWRRFEFLGGATPPEDRALADIGYDPHAAAEGSELSRAVGDALAALPPRQRAAVVLARYEGCTMAEVAEALDISVGAAKVLLHRARAQLAKHLSPFLLPAAQEAP